MKRSTLLAVAGVILAVAALAAWFFYRPAHTRLTVTPASLAQLVPAVGGKLPAPAHVVVVVEENKTYDDLLETKQAPYIHELMRRGAVLTHSYGVAHPSQPNYVALFSGQTNRDGDKCALNGVSPDSQSLGGALFAAHRTFIGYAEDLPAPGSKVCSAGQYARKHAPWTHFNDVPDRANLPLSALNGYDKLPTVAFIIPNLLDDMHSASIARGDAWLRRNIDPLLKWGATHDTLFVLTWDENDGSRGNHILTLLVGPMVKPGNYDGPVNHFGVLRTIEEFYHLPALGASAQARPMTGMWKAAAQPKR